MGWTSIHLSVMREGNNIMVVFVKLRPVTKLKTKHIIKKAFSRAIDCIFIRQFLLKLWALKTSSKTAHFWKKTKGYSLRFCQIGWIATNHKTPNKTHHRKGLTKSYWMHTLVLKSDNPDSSYRLSRIAARWGWYAVHVLFILLSGCLTLLRY